MNSFFKTFVMVAGLAMQDTPPLQEMLDRIVSNVQELQNTLPDITCKETLSLKPKNPRLSSYSHEALLTTSRLRGRGEVYFRVSRQVTSARGTPSTMINVIQNLLADVTLAFGPASRGSTNYKFVRRQNLRNVPAYVIDFETRKGASASNRGGTLTGLGDPSNTMKGKSWVDSRSMQVLRLETTVRNIMGRAYREDTVSEYGPVIIDGKVYWLLTKLSKKNEHNEWAVEYSECRKFEVTSQIRPVQ